MSQRGPEARPNYRAIVEGRCPVHGGALERRDGSGWCQTCGHGWSYRTTGPKESEVSVHFEFDVSKLVEPESRFRSVGAQRVIFSRWTTEQRSAAEA